MVDHPSYCTQIEGELEFHHGMMRDFVIFLGSMAGSYMRYYNRRAEWVQMGDGDDERVSDPTLFCYNCRR